MIELTIDRAREGYRVSAWRGDDYVGAELFIGYSKREALARARETIEREGGLGNYRGIILGA